MIIDNTPLNADDDGLDKAAQLLGIYLEEIDVDGYVPINVNRQTLANILTDRKKHELQARIDELTDLWPKFTDIQLDGTNGPEDNHRALGFIYRRIAELKQELEKL